ncbi:unnamed protein product [Allacma fusca]|uniref:Non-lysosomal glucosylceramidase n=1 Tax=Allacma fusca TaxID=39272 RepID=A0A8J2Q0V5_9HEXA|nr:unnamed protein product [Allacma fusca]
MIGIKRRETWDQNLRPKLKQLPDLLPLFLRYFFWWIGTWMIRGVKPFIDLYMLQGKQIYGVPCGGIGAGTIGRGFKGQFCRFQMTPGLYTYDVCHADQFIVTVRDTKGSLLYQKVLSGVGDPGTLSAWDWSFDPAQGSYTGLFPRAWYTYRIPEQSLVLTCKQISPVIPHNYKDSCMPATVFVWTVENNDTKSKEVSITFTFKNGTGSKHDGNGKCSSETFFSAEKENSKIQGVALEHNIQGIDVTYGISSLQKANQVVTNMTQFDVKTGADLWTKLGGTGRLDVESSRYELKRGEVGSAVCCSSFVGAHENDEMVFSLVWHQPLIHFKGKQRQHTRRYVRFIDSKQDSNEDIKETTAAVRSLSTYCLNNYIAWDVAICKWQDTILKDTKLPSWFKSAIFNELYFIADGGSIWIDYTQESLPKLVDDTTNVRNDYGRFAYLEAHEYRMYNTYDVHFYASFALIHLWPKLQLSLQYDIADAVRYKDESTRIHLFDGCRSARKIANSVVHDIGDPSEDPFLRVNSYRIHDVSEWRDLNLKFVLQVYRDFKFTQDQKFLQDMLPVCDVLMKKSMKWDTDGDGLIENSGSADQTYDTWIMKGPSAYCGSLWLASLYSIVEMIKTVDMDPAVKKGDLELYQETLERGRKSFQEKLWTGDYYKFDTSEDQHGQSIMADQLCGYWFLAMCDEDVSQVFPKSNVLRALKTLYEKNVQSFCDGQLGAVNGMNPDGTIDYFTMQSEEVWTGVTYSLAATMIYNGMTDEGFKTAEGIYRTVYEKIGMGFETPEALYSTKKYRAIGYMRPLSIWSIMQAWKLRKKQDQS